MINDGTRGMKSIYLCGPINKCSDDACHGWRTEVEQALAGRFRFLNPMRRDYRNREENYAAEIVEQDYQDIRKADIILAMANHPSWGTAMEIHQAFSIDHKLVVAVCTDPKPSPWLRYHCHYLAKSLREAIEYIVQLGDKVARIEPALHERDHESANMEHKGRSARILRRR
jgi:nucleoside 2-deoxyribosyltransferase